MDSIPSYDEYKEKVYEAFMAFTVAFGKNRRERYFKSSEAEETIKDSYIENEWMYEKGKLTGKIFLGDAANGCGYSLSMMFE